MTEIVRWVTMHGNHIPIYDGDSEQDAINRFIAKKNEQTKHAQIHKNKKMADKLNGKVVAPTNVEDSIYSNKVNSAGGHGMALNEQVSIFEKTIEATPTQLKALKQYGWGTYDDKVAFAKKHDLEQLIDNNVSLHLGGAKLFRGGYVDDKEYDALLNGKNTNMLKGVTSWSLREDVAHMYAQGDPYTGEVFGGRKAEGGHRVIFVEDKTNDSLPLPYTYPHAEALRSNRNYTITKIIKESEYSGKETDGGRSAAHSGFDEPVTYIYVKSEKRRR